MYFLFCKKKKRSRGLTHTISLKEGFQDKIWGIHNLYRVYSYITYSGTTPTY